MAGTSGGGCRARCCCLFFTPAARLATCCRYRQAPPLYVDVLLQLRPIVGNDFHPCSCVYAEGIVRLDDPILPPTSLEPSGGCGPTDADPTAVFSGSCGLPNYLRIPFPSNFVFNQSVAENWALTLTVVGSAGGETDTANRIE